MMTKKILFFLTFLLCLTGGGELWAEQVTFNLANGSSSDTRVSPVSLTTSGNFQTDNDKLYRNGLRIDAGGYIELTADAGYSISQVQITFTPDDNDNPISNIRSSSLTSITINTDETASWGQTFSNKNYTTYGVLTRTLVEPRSSIKFSFDGSSGSVYVKQLDVTYSVDNRSEIAVFSSTNTWPTVYNYVDNAPSSMTIHGPQNNSSSIFVIKIVATNEEASSGTYSNRFDTNKLHVSVEDPTVITLGTVHHQNYSGTSGNRQQMYFSDFTILKEGSTRIVVSFDGDENYLPKTVYYDITTKNIRHSSLYSSYPFTWDFANNDWESSKIQMAANSTDWASYSGEGRSKQTSVSATSGIDMIEGLAFSGLTADDGSNSNGTLCLDWTNKWIWLNGTVTLPVLSKGHVVTFTSSADPTVVPENVTLVSSEGGAYQYKATADVATPAFTFGGTRISSISVTKSSVSITRSGRTSTHLKGNPPTLKLGTSTNYGNYAFNLIDGVNNTDFTVTVSPSEVLSGNPTEMKYTDENGGYYYLTLTAASVGTAHVTVSLNSLGDGYESVTPYEFDVRVVQTATPHKWNFEDSEDYWTTTSGQLNASYWVESADATANPGEVMSNVAFSGEELTKDGTNKIPEMEGLVMTAVKGSSRFNIGKYYRLGNYSKASITIPSMTTGQTVTFKVETATSGMERGITATSSNLELISGQVSDKVSYYTFRVTSDGDGEFRQTSEVAGLKIYYIDLKAATPAATELKFVDSSNNDISNKQVNIVSGSVTGALNSYFQLSKSSGTKWNDVTVTVDPSSLLTHDGDGTFTMGSGTGTATITARTTDSSVETGIAVLYVSVKAQPTVTLSNNGPFIVNYGQDFNGGSSTVTGTSSDNNLAVKYKSSNERVATVDASGHVTCVGVGTTTITAYTEETNDYLPAEASYQLTYNAGNVIFQFEPSEVKLALGKNITPFLHYDQKGQLDPASLNFTMSKSGIVTCEIVTDARQTDKNVIKITSVDDASKIGETVIVTASATMKNSSVVYNTTIAVTITAADACNFDWVNSSDIYIYEDTYLPIPRIAGNATGNNHFSNSNKNGGNGDENGDNKRTESGNNYKYYWEGGNHYDPLHAYVYEIKHNVITWNNNSMENTNYHLNEGVPDFYLTDASNAATDKGYILWAKSSNNAYGDTLLVYAKTEGIIKLHAKDSQNDTECTPITIHIMPKSTIYGSGGELETQINTISFPYTWDFTSNEDLSALDNSIYWDKENNNYYNAPLTMNVNFADGLDNGATNTKTHLAFLGATSNGEDHHILPWFKGLKIQLGNSTYNSKIHKIRISPYTSPGNSRLYLSGGTHTITLPHPGYNNPATGFYEPESYKVFIKLHTTGSTEVELKAGDSNDSYKSFDKDGTYTKIYANSDVILSKTVARGEQVSIGLADCNIYWIAMSTEAKSIGTAAGGSDHMASYSYSQTMDYGKSFEANDVDAYVATAVTNKGSASNPALKVTLQKSNTSVPSGTGVVLKATAAKNAYMIADARNEETYESPSVPATNLLRGTGNGCTIYELAGDETGTTSGSSYVPFYLSSKFRDYSVGSGIGEQQNAGYYAYWRVYGSQSMPANYSYLVLDADTYKNTYGKPADINEGAASRIQLLFDDSDDDYGTTGIENVRDSVIDSDAWYTLQGVKVNAPAKGGIYIHKGKKVVVK